MTMRTAFACGSVLLGLAACSGSDTTSASQTSSTTAAGGTTSSAGGATATSSTGQGGGNASSSGVGGAVSSGGAGGATASSGVGGVDFGYDPTTTGAGGSETCAAVEVKGKKPPVDIVFAVDTSGSMSTEIAQVKANINGSFADVLGQGDLDYRVSMVAAKGTDTFQVCVLPPLGGPNCGSNLPIYKAVTQSVGSTNALSLLLSTYDSATPSLNWQNFLRFDATKAFILVTDDNSATSATSFDTSLLAKSPAGMFGTAQKRKYVFYGIIGIDKNNAGQKCAAAVNNGPVYQQLVTLTGGAQYSECEADYSPIFKAIASNVVAKLSCEYALPQNDPNGKAIDPQKVQVKFVDAMNQVSPFTRVDDATKCAGASWYFEDNSKPEKILLCPTACSQVQGGAGGQVKIEVGCLQG